MRIVSFAWTRSHQTFAFGCFAQLNFHAVLQAVCFCRASFTLPSVWAVFTVILLFWDGCFELPGWAGVPLTHACLSLAQLSPINVQDGTLPSCPAVRPALLLLVSAACSSNFCFHASSVYSGSQVWAYLKVYLAINHQHVPSWVFWSQKCVDIRAFLPQGRPLQHSAWEVCPCKAELDVFGFGDT